MYSRSLAWVLQCAAYGILQWSGLGYCSPIVGGNYVPKTELFRYSYVVSLQDRHILENGTSIFVHFCGGSLISSSWILTAGHCVYFKKVNQTFAVIGYLDLKGNDVGYRDIDAFKLINFVPSNLKNDIALVQLKDSIVLDENRSLGLIPNPEMKGNQPCRVIGYGADRYGGKIQNNLKVAEVYVISQNRCTQILGKIMAPQDGDLAFCVLGESKDSCQGDSGGPLLCSVDGNDYIFGIVSHGLTCGQPGVPSIYTVTAPYKQWIDSVINKN